MHAHMDFSLRRAPVAVLAPDLDRFESHSLRSRVASFARCYMRRTMDGNAARSLVAAVRLLGCLLRTLIGSKELFLCPSALHLAPLMGRVSRLWWREKGSNPVAEPPNVDSPCSLRHSAMFLYQNPVGDLPIR